MLGIAGQGTGRRFTLTHRLADKDPLSSLFTCNLTAKEALLSEQVINGTGQWFFETDDFQRWENKEVETLWCPGERKSSAYTPDIRLTRS